MFRNVVPDVTAKLDAKKSSPVTEKTPKELADNDQ